MKYKIYAVVSNDRYTGINVEKCFTDIEKAQAYKERLEEDDKQLVWLAKKCRKCNRHDDRCPFYIEALANSDGCDSWNAFYESIGYSIVETELDDGKKD